MYLNIHPLTDIDLVKISSHSILGGRLKDLFIYVTVVFCSRLLFTFD